MIVMIVMIPLDRYLEWLVGYQFPTLTQFFARVEELVVNVGAGDVTYHEPKKNLEATLKKQGDMKVDDATVAVAVAPEFAVAVAAAFAVALPWHGNVSVSCVSVGLSNSPFRTRKQHRSVLWQRTRNWWLGGGFFSNDGCHNCLTMVVTMLVFAFSYQVVLGTGAWCSSCLGGQTLSIVVCSIG